MAMTAGLINAPRAKKPQPLASSKGFVWPKFRDAPLDMKHKLAASLRELMLAKGTDHVELQKTLWGTYDSGGSRSLKIRQWVQAEGLWPTDVEAAYIAQQLNVPVERLLKPESPFTPANVPVKTRAKRLEKIKKANGADHPARQGGWLLPVNADRPRIKIETSEVNSKLMRVELTADVPPEVAIALMSMLNDYQYQEAAPAGAAESSRAGNA